LDSFNNKRGEILATVDSTKPDIIAFCEIFAKNAAFKLNDAELAIPQYDMFLNINAKRGVVLYANKCLNAREIDQFDKYNFEESTWCTFESINKEKVLFGCIYRSPNSSKENTER
jgi:hypothetical protein